MADSLRFRPHSVKRWHLESVGLQAGDTEMSVRDHPSLQQTVINQTRFSSWTPIASKSFNKQLFHERVNLIGHWFDLWTDKQRKQFLHSILMRSSRSQLKFVQDWFTEEVPVTKLDFTTVLPRFLSLYIMSFLNPQDLCSAAQVTWHWKFLSEQDCLWMPKCTKFGWFLPYTPSDNEYGAWKRHYISCASTLDYLTPREAAETYGTLNELKKEDEERLQEKWLRKLLRERLALHKRELFKTRPPWMSGTWRSALLGSKLNMSQSKDMFDQKTLQAALLLLQGKNNFSSKTLSNQLMDELNQTSALRLTVEKTLVEKSVKALPKSKNVAVSTSYPTLPHTLSHSIQRRYGSISTSNQQHLLLISSNVPAYEVVLNSVKPNVIPIVYDFNGLTTESLLFHVEKTLAGQTAQSIGIVTDSDTQHINLLQGCSINSQNVLTPEIRNFWEKLGSCVISEKEGGHIDLFAPLAATESGMEILNIISQMTGLHICSPTAISAGSYQHILSEWLTGSKRYGSPPLIYFSEVKVQAWCRMAHVMEEALLMVRKNMKRYLGDLQMTVAGRIIGQFMLDSMIMTKVQTNQEVAEALIEGLVELSKGKCDKPLEFLSVFLMKKCTKNKEFIRQLLSDGKFDDSLTAFLKEDAILADKTSLLLSESEFKFQHLNLLDNKLLSDLGDKRTRFAREILRSERQYVQSLQTIRDIYVVPLKAALSSNRAILSIANVQIIFADILDILQINKQLLDDLTERLQEWGPAQCLGDVFVKFGSRLKIYTNFFNNYTVILKTIDKCRETIPTFRTFLKRHDQTVLTKMMSLQELLLLPSTRFEDYVNLLYALRLHTSPEHPDRQDITTAVGQMKQYKDYIAQLKTSLEKDTEMTKIQKTIQGCPNLLEANRHLIKVQDLVLLNCPNEEISASLRVYEQISDLSLFLFNDALVISSRQISYIPFQRTPNTLYQFMASVSIARLILEDIPDSKYVKNAFVLQGPKRQWICSTINEEEKFTWLSVCQSAISASIEKR
ncbi:epithelial cell-transforming sequence 2 oncogene-like [Bombina bombina]|uniref:epithelial cell-transforming sequence 2 oncogene-like n=1 Tax=Bombina bombina TaxID=8345 RepID=UPI00235A8DB8|nr:epithelial cell-transforming sequence 2 oncogene-like [Bombina bombina]